VRVNPGGPDDPRNRNSNEKEEQKMNKTVKILTIVSIFSLFLFGSSAFAQGGKTALEQEFPEIVVGVNYHPTGEFPEASSVGYHPMGWDTFRAGGLIGYSVHSPQGGVLGQIDNLMIDRANGHIALVILSGVEGFGAKYVAAPFSALERTGNDTFQLNFGDQYPSIPSSYYEDPYAYLLFENMSTVGLSRIPSRIDPLWADSLYRFYGQAPYWTEGRAVPPDIMAYRTAEPSILNSLLMGKTAPVLMGANVQSKNGKAEARIDDLVIDSRDGRVAFLVLDRVPGRGDLEVAVPFGELSMKGNTFVLDTTGERLAAAPSFDEYSDMNNLKWAESVYRFFGQRPYWTEGGQTGGMDPYRWGGEAQDF
jgi:sporulation protein YlmC with PRC-barrel domain